MHFYLTTVQAVLVVATRSRSQAVVPLPCLNLKLAPLRALMSKLSVAALVVTVVLTVVFNFVPGLGVAVRRSATSMAEAEARGPQIRDQAVLGSPSSSCLFSSNSRLRSGTALNPRPDGLGIDSPLGLSSSLF